MEVQEIFSAFPNLGVYATGSFGRLEAGERSDIDLFFIIDDLDGGKAPGKIDKIRMDSFLIDLIERFHFPPLSNDGEYLQYHSAQELQDKLGGRDDDYLNLFTARMLLLLESRPICHAETYNRMVDATLECYFRDYHDHETGFRPIFLINDIIRFWKTLCLNYENKRTLKSDDPKQKAKNHLRNLKLKYRSLLFCFATIIYIMRREAYTKESIRRILGLTPIKRLIEAFEDGEEDEIELVNGLLSEYAWFLSTSGKEDAAEWINETKNRDEAFANARRFSDKLYQLLVKADRKGSLMRYLVM